MERREALKRPPVRARKAPTRPKDEETGAADAIVGGRMEVLSEASVLKLQKTAGNASVAATMVQRGPAAATKHRPVKHDEFAGMFAITLDGVIGGGGSFGPADVEGLPQPYVTFLEHYSQALFGSRFGSPKVILPDEEREAELSSAETMMAGIGVEILQAPDGAALFSRAQGTLSSVASVITQHAVVARAQKDAALAAQLKTRPVQEAREQAGEVMKKTYDVYSKFSDQVEKSGYLLGKGGHESGQLGLGAIHGGIEAGIGIAKATDPETYRKAVAEAREWIEEHNAGAAMGTIRSASLVSEIAELTVGTGVKAASAMSKLAIVALKPTGTTLEMLEELHKSGELVMSSGRVALKFQKVVEFAEKFETVMGAINVVGGVAKFVTGETKGEKADGLVKMGTGAATVVAKVVGKELIGAGASSVVMTWEMVKFFGEMGLDATEGMLYGGLYQELTEIEPKVDQLAQALLVTERAIAERDKRFGDKDVTDSKRYGADEAIENLGYEMQKKLRIAAIRWQNSSIPTLYRNFKYGRTSSGGQLQGEVANVLSMDRDSWQPGGAEVGMIVGTANDFVREFRHQAHDAPFIVLQMAVDQNLMTPERAAQMGEKLRKAAQKAE